MNGHAQRLEALTVRVQVPGAAIGAALTRRNEVTLEFGPGEYQRLTDADLEHHLATVARLLHTAWLRAYRQTLDPSIVDTPGVDNDTDRAFYDARAEVVGRGASPDGRIRLTAHGPQRVTAGIARGTVAELSEEQFVEAFRAAGVALILDYTAQVDELKDRIYR
ncbi:hypothetical protein [Dactylosporangium sp. CA-233914]|uniref:hypothetical protein n=1 Tax=Dactylosporangium sp. CA-233914 TaxID=3239934 RepID=UPI003D8A7CAE